jgi:hypothetical protein
MKNVVAFAASGLTLMLLGGSAGDPARRSEAETGPYRVVVDRIAHNRKITLNYDTPEKAADGAPAQFARTVHLQLAVFAKDLAAGAGLSTFQIRSVTAENGTRMLELPYYGGMLETANDGAALRAYIYLSNFPLAAKEVRAIEGEVVAYERSTPMQIDIPVTVGKIPTPVEKNGIRATVREWVQEKDEIRAVISLEAPPNTVLINTTTDGTYGVALLNNLQRPANTQGGSMIQARSNQAEYRVGFINLRGTPDMLKIKVLHRSGPRRVYPFRIEHVEIPTRTSAGSAAGAQGGPDQQK